MSEEVTTVLNGWKKILAATVPTVVTGVNAAIVGVNLPLPESYDLIPMAAWLVKACVCMAPSIASIIGGVKYMAENVKQDIAHTEATAKVETAKSTPMFDNPEYGKRQVSQAEERYYKVIAQPQLKPDFPNAVSRNLEVWSKMAASDEGAFQILMDRIGVFIDEEYKRWSTSSLQDIESLKEFAKRYLGVALTSQDCEAVSANKNLATVVHAEADKTIIASIYTAHKAGTLGPGVWEGCKVRALYYARKSVIDTVQRKLISEDLPLVREGMADLGLNDYTQRTAISGAGTWYVNIGGGPRICDPFALAGIDSITMKPLG